MSLTGDTFDFQQGNVVTSSAQLVDSAATVGDVLTVQTDKSIAAAPGGGSLPGAAIVRGPFAFAFNTAGLADGVAFYTPTADDILLDAWIEVDTAFDGTTPFADIGPFDGGTVGYFGNTEAAIDLTAADNIRTGTHLKGNTAGSGPWSNFALSLGGVFLNGTDLFLQRATPGKILTADPLLLVVSQDGSKGGTPVGGAAGAGKVYLVTATPAAFA